MRIRKTRHQSRFHRYFSVSIKFVLLPLAVFFAVLLITRLVILLAVPLPEANAPIEQQEQLKQLEHFKPTVIAPTTTSLTLVAVGDNLIHLPLVKSAKQPDGSYDFTSYYSPVASLVQAADVSIVNQETILGGDHFAYSGYPQFNSPTEVGDALVQTGFNVIMQANNHAMDMRYQGIEKTLAFWEQSYSDVLPIGLNTSLEQQQQIPIIEKNGIKIALLNYTFSTNGIPVPKAHPYAVNLLQDEVWITQQITSAKQQADVVVVLPHWGTEYATKPDSLQQKWVELFASQGVDLVIGTHPHVLQPVTWVDRPNGGQMLVYYSLGNFISRQTEVSRMLGGMAQLRVEKTGDDVQIKDASLIPLVTHYDTTSSYHFAVYPLFEYDEALASKHRLRQKSSNMTPERLSEAAIQVAGDFVAE